MNRIFLGLVVTAGSLLVITFILGFFAHPAPGEGGALRIGHDLHVLLSIATVLFTLMAHSIVYTYFIGTGKWVKEVASVYQLPSWVEGQSKKNKRRVFPFVFWSMMATGAAAWLGAAVDTTRGMDPLWHLAAAAGAIAFNFGAFAAEYAVIVSQARLILEVKEQADRIREASMQSAGDGAEGGSLTPTVGHSA
jgi:hypothetical protein